MNTSLIIECAKRILKDNTVAFELLDNSLKIDGAVYPLTPWRYDRQLMEIRNLAIKNKMVKDICSYKSQRIEAADKCIYTLLYEELDTCEWILGDKIVSVFADINSGKYITLILKTKRGILCNIIVSTTLPIGTKPVTKHEIVGREGFISERPINIQIPEEAVYLFSEEKTATYTDNDLGMLGLTPKEIMIADNIVDLVKNKPCLAKFGEEITRNEYLLNSAKKSAQKGNIVVVGEV